MNPHSKRRPLLFTPRSPWGGRLESHSFRSHMRASEDDPKESKGLFLNPGSDEKDPTGLYIKPEFDDKNPEGRTGLNLDLGWRGKFGKTGQIVLRGASDEYVQRRNKAFQDSLRKSGIDPTGKILFIKG